MGLLTPTILVRFTDEELVDIAKPEISEAKEKGGWQDLVVLCRERAVSDPSLFEDEELRRIRRYAYDMGRGTYQVCFRAVVRAAVRAGWGD